ncbi:hypothetical protein [Streptomyces collinus]|uniref:hypothetical protein n=1 Tax=Streptomyces collinus TaxID=42684 RepID=UPI0037D529B6
MGNPAWPFAAQPPEYVASRLDDIDRDSAENLLLALTEGGCTPAGSPRAPGLAFTIEAVWPSRKEHVGRVQLEGELLAGLGPVDVRGARRDAPRAVEPARLRRPHDRPVLPAGAARTCP